jgi:septum formation protein
MRLILASGSPTRRMLLANAGVAFEVIPADIDERAAEAPLISAGALPEDLALALAMAKAVTVSEQHADALVIGADQTLDLAGERLTKPPDMEAARRQLLSLSGRTHQLHSAVACARGGGVAWQHLETANLKMRRLEPREVGQSLARAGADALKSVGAYRIEGPAIQLFDDIDGDYFGILGLPLLPLLKFLRGEGALA